MANKAKVKPHHKVPADWRKFVAAKVTGVPYSRPASATLRIVAYTATYSGGSTATYAGTSNFSLSGASLSAVSFYSDAANYALADNFAVLGTAATLAGATNNISVASGATVRLANGTFSSDLVKSGSGTLTLATSATYTGSTFVNAGTLSLTSALLRDSSTVSLVEGATLNLNFAGSDTINQLRIGGVAQSPGTWGSLTSDATFKTALITGEGILNVVGIDGTLTINLDTLGSAGTTLTTGTGTLIGGVGQLGAGTNAISGGTLTLSNAGNVEVTSGTTTVITNPLTTIDSGSVLVVTSGTLNAATLTLQTNGIDAGASQALGAPTQVPEPSTALLAVLGAGLLFQSRRRS